MARNPNWKRWEDYDTIQCPDGTIIDVHKLLDELATAEASCVHLAPWLGGYLGKLQRVLTFRLPTFAVSQTHLFVNPQFASGLDMTEKVFVYFHELMHVLLNHLRRGAGHDQKRSNIAADYECNITIADLGLIRIGTMEKLGAYVDKKYSGWGYEKIYADNSMETGDKNRSDAPKPEGGDSTQGGGNSSGDGGHNNSEGSDEGTVQPGDQQGAQGEPLSRNITGGMLDKKTADEIAEQEGYEVSSASEEALSRDWADAAQKAARAIGSGAKGADLFKAKINGQYKTAHDWKKELKNIVGRSLSPTEQDQRFTNKNTLVSQGRISRTGKDKYDHMDSMMVWIDTSGSMTDELLIKVLTEVYALALAKKPMKLVIYQFDTDIADVQEYTSMAEFKRAVNSFQMKGGGGTDVKCCFDKLRRDYPGPCELVLIFTDGFLQQYKRPPRDIKNLVWVLIDNSGFSLAYKDRNTKAVWLDSSAVR